MPSGGTCVCPPAAPNKCGPDCCTGTSADPYPRPPTHPECGDNECCFGTYLPEEFCCPTNTRAGGLPPLATVCRAANECCQTPSVCCRLDGCCDTVCVGGDGGADSCCPADDFCPGGEFSSDLCCTGNTTCCRGGTNGNACIDTSEGQCCTGADCDNGCIACVNGACIPQCTRQECCTAAPGRADWFCLEGDRCCTSEDCNDPPDACSTGVCGLNNTCVYTGCDEGLDCCATGLCVPDGSICCTPPLLGLDEVTPAQVPLICPKCMICNIVGHCVPVDDGDPCGLISDDDDADEGICCGGQCLADANCCTDTQCDNDEICCADVHVCGLSCNGGVCCPGGFCDGNGLCCLPPNVGCNGGTCCDGFCDTNGECCPAGKFGCNRGVCCDVECDREVNCPPPPCAPNCECSDASGAPINVGLDCNGGIAAGGGVCAFGYCVVPLEGCPCRCAGDTECVRCDGNGICETYNQNLSCKEGAGIRDGEWCVDAPPPACEPNCDCTDSANDGLECNGGGGPVCGCGFCVIPLGDCLCGCDGDTECIHCVGDECQLYNQGGSCNGGAGTCQGPSYV